MDRERAIEILEGFAVMNVTAKEYCKQCDFNYTTFRRWAKRLNFDIRQKAWHRGQHPASRAMLSSTAPIKHGVYSFIRSGLVPCDRCDWSAGCEHFKPGESCTVLADFQSAKMLEIMDMPQIKPEDAPLAEMAVREMAIQALIMRYTSRVGVLRKQDDALGMQPVMSQYWCSVNSLARLCDRLGIGPQARKALKLDDKGFNLAQAILDSGDDK